MRLRVVASGRTGSTRSLRPHKAPWPGHARRETLMTANVFSSLKVIDCASWIAGPAAATILSDFGADVIKIEPPGAGDPWRASTPVPGKPTDYYWQLTSRNKRSLAIDLKQADGLTVLYRLLASADVFVTNFPLPVRERLKIDASHVLPLNP